MSYRAITKRITYIDSRLRHRQDYPSAPELARGLAQQHGESVSKRTIERDMDKMRDRGAPIEYDPRRHGYYYTDMSWQLPGIDLVFDSQSAQGRKLTTREKTDRITSATNDGHPVLELISVYLKRFGNRTDLKTQALVDMFALAAVAYVIDRK